MKEIWKDVNGFEGAYKVSNLGSVISLDRVIKYNSKTIEYSKRIIGKVIKEITTIE